MLGKNFSLLFYLKKPKNYCKGNMPIYLRITVDGISREISTGRQCDPDRWNCNACRAIGVKEDVKSLNIFLDVLQNKIYEIRLQLLEKNQLITAEHLKRVLKGQDDDIKMILEIFQQHNDQMKMLIGKDYSPATLERFKTSYEHTKAFIQWNYSLNDIDVKKLDFQFISQYEFWLKTVKNCSHNTSMKYLANFKKVVRICIRSGWLEKDPFIDFKLTKKEVIPEFLTEHELAKVAAKEFTTARLSQVRDIFLFCCYTGLAFADVEKLKPSEIGIGVDGSPWIFTKRRKTDTISRIPLLPTALEIIERYQHHPAMLNSSKLLPVLSNQKYNEYLKEIAAICSVQKKMTTHTARHTFATTVTLGNGVPMESVSKMLGHKNLKTTQHYAKVLDKKISDDMNSLREKMQLKNTGKLKAI